jgi:hypothetical protein
MAETVHLSMTRQQLLDVRARADHRDQPDALYYGQRIIGYHEFTTGGAGALSRRRAELLARHCRPSGWDARGD